MSGLENKTARYGLYGAIIAAVIGSAVTLFIHFDSRNDSSAGESQETNQRNTDDGGASVSISDVFISPVAFDSPAYFYTEIRNIGSDSASGFQVTVDFGRSTPGKCEVRPNDIIVQPPDTDSGSLRFSVVELARDGSIYVRCDLSLPSFDRILVSGGNIAFDKTLTFTDAAEDRTGGRTELNGVLLVLFMFVGLPFSIYLLAVTIKLINKWLKLQW